MKLFTFFSLIIITNILSIYLTKRILKSSATRPNSEDSEQLSTSTTLSSVLNPKSELWVDYIKNYGKYLGQKLHEKPAEFFNSSEYMEIVKNTYIEWTYKDVHPIQCYCNIISYLTDEVIKYQDEVINLQKESLNDKEQILSLQKKIINLQDEMLELLDELLTERYKYIRLLKWCDTNIKAQTRLINGSNVQEIGSFKGNQTFIMNFKV